MKFLVILFATITLASCSANEVKKEAENIEIVNEKPDPAVCKYLGEIVGSQNNSFVSNENLVIGARNELRNEAFKLGGNLVYMQTHSSGYNYSTNIGKAYLCSDRPTPISSNSEQFYKKRKNYITYCIKFADTLSPQDLALCKKVEPYMREKYPSMF